ncbi:MAG: NHL repeat-containing protein [Blastocatellia bacterium]|nr:NHL repeat-containing protein [Blastocatellia bacterium]
MRSSNLITRSLVCLAVFILLITTIVFQPVQSNSLPQENQTINSPLVSDNPRTGKIIPKVENEKKEYVLGMPIWDNGDFDGIDGLVSEVNSSYGESRTADDFILNNTAKINFITVQMYSSLNPHQAQLEIYNDMGMDALGRPINDSPIATYLSTSFTQVGSGYGYPIVEFTFDTPGLTLPAGKYWVCPMGLGAIVSSKRAFFATTGDGNIQLEPGYFKSPFHSYPNWGIHHTVVSDFAFKVYASNTGVDHLSVYAADTKNNRIQRSTDDGATWHMIGYGPGLTAGKFNAPRGVTANSNDMIIFVADTMNNRIQRSTNGGVSWQIIAPAGTITGKVNQPYGLAYDENMDRLYVADTLNNRIQVAMGAATATPVFNIFEGATAGTAIGKFNQPVSVAVSADSNSIYVSDTSNNRIQVYNIAEGTWSIFAGATAGTAVGKVNQPHGIYVDNIGRVYVADHANNRIQMISTMPEKFLNGNSGWTVFMGPGTAIGTVNKPCGVVYSASGNVFVGDTFNNRVQKKNLETDVVTIVGGPGLPMGYFYQPTGIR